MSLGTTAAVDRAERDLGELLEAHRRVRKTNTLARFREDILAFVAHCWPAVVLWEAQREHLLAVQRFTRVAAFGGNGTGKSFDDAIIALWAIYCWDALVIATSAMERQLIDQFMRDVRRLFAGAPELWGEVRTLGIRRPDNPDSGLLCMAAGSTHNLRSYHAARIMVQLHEGQGLPAFAYESAEIMAVGIWDRVTVTGNPVDPSGDFYKRCTSPHWHPQKFDSRLHPNILSGTTAIAGGPSRESIAQRARDYGETSAFFISSVTGEFPSESAEALVRRGWVEAAQARWPGDALQFTPGSAPVMGVDVAALGGDRSVVAVRSGRTITHLRMLPVSDTMTTVEAIIGLANELGLIVRRADRWHDQPLALVRVDSIGVGCGVADRLVELGVNCERFAGSGAPRYSQEVVLNARAEAFWTIRILLEKGELDLPPDEFLLEELVGLTCRPNTATGTMQMEDKDLFRCRNKGRSPDRADALSLATYGMWKAAPRGIPYTASDFATYKPTM